MGTISIRMKRRSMLGGDTAGNPAFSVVTCGRRTVTTGELVSNIERSSSLTRGDVLAVLSALGRELESFLSEGFHVHLDDLGTFGISLTCAKAAAGGDPQCADVAVRRITFKAERSLVGRVRAQASFTADGGLRRPARRLTRAEVVALMRAQLASRRAQDFTRADVAYGLGAGMKPAVRLLSELEADGTVGCRTVGRTYLYHFLV